MDFISVYHNNVLSSVCCTIMSELTHSFRLNSGLLFILSMLKARYVKLVVSMYSLIKHVYLGISYADYRS